MSRNKKTVLALVLILGIGALAWAFLPAGPDPQLVKVQQMQQKLFSPDKKLTPEQRREAFGEFRQEAEKLTPEQRDEMMRNNPMVNQMRKTVVGYFDLPESQRKAELDKQIDEWEKRRKQMQKDFAGGNRPPGPPGGGFGNRGNMDEGQRNQMRKNMLDKTSPQERAMFTEYMKDMEKRRKERGMPSMGPRFGG